MRYSMIMNTTHEQIHWMIEYDAMDWRIFRINDQVLEMIHKNKLKIVLEARLNKQYVNLGTLVLAFTQINSCKSLVDFIGPKNLTK